MEEESAGKKLQQTCKPEGAGREDSNASGLMTLLQTGSSKAGTQSGVSPLGGGQGKISKERRLVL